MTEKTRKLNSLEEKLTSIRRQHQEKVSNVQEKIDVLQNQFEERVNIQTEINDKVNTHHKKIERELITDGETRWFCFAVVSVVVIAVLVGLVNHEKFLEEKINDVQSERNWEANYVQSQLEKKMNDVQSQLEKKVHEVQKKADWLNTDLSDKIMLLNANEPRTFTWKVKGFEDILSQAKNRHKIKVQSDPFYMFGYKLKLLMYPDRIKRGANTHLSLFFAVMKGEYDAILPWPFHKEVKFTLIEQLENPAERKSVTVEFTTDPKQVNYFDRPKTVENMGWGYPKFVSHKDLKTRRFVVDDILFIQIQVGPPSTS